MISEVATEPLQFTSPVALHGNGAGPPLSTKFTSVMMSEVVRLPVWFVSPVKYDRAVAQIAPAVAVSVQLFRVKDGGAVVARVCHTVRVEVLVEGIAIVTKVEPA